MNVIFNDYILYNILRRIPLHEREYICNSLDGLNSNAIDDIYDELIQHMYDGYWSNELEKIRQHLEQSVGEQVTTVINSKPTLNDTFHKWEHKTIVKITVKENDEVNVTLNTENMASFMLPTFYRARERGIVTDSYTLNISFEFQNDWEIYELHFNFREIDTAKKQFTLEVEYNVMENNRIAYYILQCNHSIQFTYNSVKNQIQWNKKETFLQLPANKEQIVKTAIWSHPTEGGSDMLYYYDNGSYVHSYDNGPTGAIDPTECQVIHIPYFLIEHLLLGQTSG